MVAHTRRRHHAVESAINNLEQRGLDRVRTRGAAGFERTVDLSILAANLHRISLIAQGGSASASSAFASAGSGSPPDPEPPLIMAVPTPEQRLDGGLLPGLRIFGQAPIR
ncbi:MAG: hypothetical protein OXC26_03875 [Albidovulum sp.]|nr:hypothetical protein [Albidovulum sp.]